MTNEEFIESIRLQNEEWRDVVGYEGYYMVSSLGRIVLLSRYNKAKNNRGCYAEPRLQTIRIGTNHGSYYYVRLSKNNVRKRYGLHRIIAQAFIPNPNNYPCIDHINRDSLDNRICNLRWCTHKMNMNNENTTAHMSMTRKGKPNMANRKSVVCIKDGAVIKTYNYVIETQKDGFIPTAVSRVCLGKSKSHHGYKWMHFCDYESLVKQNVKELSSNG